jgi:hypothetical protein
MSEQLWQKFVRRPRGRETIQPCEREMKELLDAWDAPRPSRALDEGVMAAYRARFQKPSFWRRVFAAEIRLPVPAAAAFALLCCGLGWLALGKSTTAFPPRPMPAVETKVIEVPVVQEKIVTRTVYVARREPTARRGASALVAGSQNNQQEQPASPAISLGSQVAGDSAYTSVNLAGFQPVDEIKATVIKGRNNNER